MKEKLTYLECDVRGQVLIVEPGRKIGGHKLTVEINDHDVQVWIDTAEGGVTIVNVLKHLNLR